MDSLKEISQYLNIESRLDLKAIALEHILSVTWTEEGKELLLKLPDLLKQLVLLIQDPSAAIAKDAALTLINITADEPGANALLIISESLPNEREKRSNDLVKTCVDFIMDKNSKLADPCCMILSNMTRPLRLVDRIVTLIENHGSSWDAIVAAFTAKQYNNNGAKLHYLGPVFSNLSQCLRFRSYLMDRERSVIQRLLAFTEFKESTVRRGGVIGTLKNCCFDAEHHEWLLGPDVDVLSYLMLPLAGPEEFDEEENDKLPLSLQYLPETKEREPDVDIRIMLLGALHQLCATKRGREILRGKNLYVILREYHKWEENKAALLACENVVDILIRTEEEIGLDNLKEVQVPAEYQEKFHQMDEDFINET